jgi:hypothetical protein
VGYSQRVKALVFDINIKGSNPFIPNMLKYIYRKFQWVVDLLVDGYLEFKRKVSRSMLKESIIPLPEYFKKNYLEKCIRYELSDNQRGLG